MALLVNGELISDEMIEQQRALVLAGFSDPAAMAHDPRVQRLAEENAVMRAVLYQGADAAALAVPEAELATELARRYGAQSSGCSAGQRLQAERELRVSKWIAEVTRGVPPPRHKDLQAAYAANRARFTIPESVHAAHIIANVDELRPMSEARSVMEQAGDALRAGEAFATVADRFSDCAGNGGELGWVERGQMVEEFDEVVFRLAVKQRSEVFETRFGLHIAQVLQRRPMRVRGFEEVRSTLASELHDAARQRALTSFLRSRAAEADVSVVVVRRAEQPR